MSRRKEYFRYEIPKTVVDVVRAVCADYKRREQAIKYSTVTGNVLQSYIQLNNVIETALTDIEPGIRNALFEDVCQRRGYDKTPAVEIYKNGYYRRKKQFVYRVAIGLNLLVDNK